MKQAQTKIDNTCTFCKGDGFYLDYAGSEEEGLDYEKQYTCQYCNGTGLLTNKLYNEQKTSNRFNHKRDCANGSGSINI